MKKVIVAAAGVALAALLVRAFVSEASPPPGQPPNSTPAAAVGPRASRTDQELADLRERLATIERRLRAAPTPEAATPDPGRDAPAVAKEPPLTREERSARRLARFEERFLEDPPDPARDRTEATRILAALGNEELSGTQPIRVECRSRMCRVEVEHDSEEDFGKYKEKLSEVIGGGGTYLRLLEREPRYRSVAMHFADEPS